MRSTKDMNVKFAKLIESSSSILPIAKKTNYTNVEIGRYLNELGNKLTREIGLDKMSVAQINTIISQNFSIPTTLQTRASKQKSLTQQ
jgi:hypothetical protein